MEGLERRAAVDRTMRSLLVVVGPEGIELDAFYGYYTFHFEKDGKIAGMLSVNGYGAKVWFHTWHGNFIQARDFGT